MLLDDADNKNTIIIDYDNECIENEGENKKMAFNLRKKETFDYNTPQEMYQDNKLKKIHGLLDYQSAMLDEYMKNITKKNIALELPTGSGKTLIGLLIGEFRRKKYKNSVVFLCPTKQLVYQVVEQATVKFGIKATAFVGSQVGYEPKSKTEFKLCETIGVTTYSAFFTQDFFNSVDVAIMDDVHSSEEYIASNWTVKITDEDNVFNPMATILHKVLNDSDFERLTTNDKSANDVNGWCELVPMTFIDECKEQIYSCLNNGIEDKTSNYYAWLRISDNIENCNFYLENRKIYIRPWISPTKSYPIYLQLKQRILMSATLGKSGELERITGLNKITRLPIVNDWDKRGLGRRFFIMPELSLGSDYEGDIFIKLHQNTGCKSVVLSPDELSINGIRDFVNKYMQNTNVYFAKEIEISKKIFLEAEDAIVLMANRFDGVDFSDEESRMLFIYNLPKVMNIQESFLSNKMGAAVLYNERVKTRIIQAVGRCTRNPSDYSVVCIFGDSVRNEIICPEKLNLFPPELRAELTFGIEQSKQYKDVDSILEQVSDFIGRTNVWEGAEEEIVDRRNEYCIEDNNKGDLYEKLQKASEKEIEFQYSLWKKDYVEAFQKANGIVEVLNAPSLGGYKCYWQYVAGSLAYRLYTNGLAEYRSKCVQLYKNALKADIKIQWFSRLINQIEQYVVDTPINYVDDVIFNIERNISNNTIPRKYSKMIDDVIRNLNSMDGNKFEMGHKNLGTLLGYEAYDSQAGAAPDPYWIVNSKLCIVAEDKIYENDSQSIPVKHVREALTHETWLRTHEEKLDKDCEIITIFITNSKLIDEDARGFSNNIYYLNVETLKEYANRAVSYISAIFNNFVEVGDYAWRKAAKEQMIQKELTPSDFIKTIKAKKLSEL